MRQTKTDVVKTGARARQQRQLDWLCVALWNLVLVKVEGISEAQH